MEKLKEFEQKLEAFCKEFKEFKEKKVPEVGKTMEIAGVQWIILEGTNKGYVALAAETIGRMAFGKNNDWKESNIREFLNTEFLGKIEKEIGGLPEFERDLLSLDGQTEYGKCIDKISLISLDEYRKYRKYIPNYENCWWILTPDSTRCNKDSSWIRVVRPSGVFSYVNCGHSRGVRPFCIFPSEIFES